jgi:hypothetical protein
MAALFGKKDEAPGATDAGGDIAQMEAELERLAKLSLPELATEVMSKAFGPDGPGGSGKPGTIEDPTSKRGARPRQLARRHRRLFRHAPGSSDSGAGRTEQRPRRSLVGQRLCGSRCAAR